MVVNRKPTGLASSMPRGFLQGLMGAWLWTVTGAGIFGYLISREYLQVDAVGYCALFLLITASYLGSKVSWRCIRHRKMVVCFGLGGLYFASLLLIGLFLGGGMAGIGVTLLAVLAGSGAAWLLGAGEKGRSTRNYKKWKR